MELAQRKLYLPKLANRLIASKSNRQFVKITRN